MSSTTDLPTIPEARPTLRSRLLRPNRWRLGVQFALLGAFIIVIPILLTSDRLLQSSRAVLVDHEIIDLSDEANLRVNEMREDMAYLARDIRTAISKHDREPPDVAVKNILSSVQIPTIPRTGDPTTVREVRRKHLAECGVGCVAFQNDGMGRIRILERTFPAESEAREQVLLNCLNDLLIRMKRNNPMDRSGFHLQPDAGASRQQTASLPPRCILAFGPREVPKNQAEPIYAYILDMSAYIRNRQRTSPRHFYLVTDPQGRVLVQPEPARVSYLKSVSDLVPWEYPKDGHGSWFEPVADTAHRQQRLAYVVNRGGARLSYVDAPNLAYFYRKCYFPDNQPLKKLTTDYVAAARELNEQFRAEMLKDSDLRCGELTPEFHYIEISHPNPIRLQVMSDTVNAWTLRHTGQNARFTKPLACDTFQGQLTPLRVDLNDEDDPSWLIVAASVEELREDIDDRFDYIHRVWVWPTIIVACGLAIGMVLTLTRSLGRLAKAAKRLGDDKETHVPLGGPYEVSQLAITLDDLAAAVRHRDRELRERAARYETILRAAGEGIVITSATGQIEEANKAAGKMFGYKTEELIGQPITRFIQSGNSLEVPKDNDLSVDTLASFTSSLEGIRGRRRDGSQFWIEVNLRPVTLKDRIVIACIFRDITIRKESEDRIRRMNEELDARVKIRTAELEETNSKLDVALKQAEQASKAKDIFVANMSHELRQPLNIITGFTQVLIEEATDDGNQSFVNDLNKILTAANHLLALINDILDLAKISAGRMEMTLSTFDVTRMVSDVQTLVAPLAEKNRNTFHVELADNLGSMVSDERRVRQILINLLSNAFKFTAEGSVTLKVMRVSEEKREWLRFQVADTGKGMSPEHLSRLFQRFYQADSSTTREQPGTGLGLAITQSFNEILGGQPVHVTSRIGSGSEFTVTLPAEPKSKTPSLPSLSLPATPAANGNRTVLMIEDDPVIRELMTRFLTKEGFDVVEAANGDDGYRKAAECQPAVITLDVMMPGGMDGWGVLTKLKNDPRTSDIPVIMLTIVDDRGRGVALGAAEYLTKPVDWQRLGNVLKRYLAGHSSTVLAIDDDPANLEIIRRAIDREGWTMIEAANGELGLTILETERPGLILLDLMMPVLDGFGFLDELHRRYPNLNIPVVVLTAKVLTPEDYARLNGRVNRILEKGDLTKLDDLLEQLRRYLPRKDPP